MRREEEVYVWQVAAEICDKLRTYLNESEDLASQRVDRDLSRYLDGLHEMLLEEYPDSRRVSSIGLAISKSTAMEGLPLPDWWKKEYRRMWRMIDEVI